MTTARKYQVIPGVPGFYHCVSRCVRRSYLCGFDEATGQDFSHRRQWVVDRLSELVNIFAADVFAYAVMNNHCHTVVYMDPNRVSGWSDQEVADRWSRIYLWRGATSDPGTSPAPIPSREKIQVWRERLGNLSWFMRCLNEPIARRANAEDNCSGHFWEARFHSSALLDERAIVACMVYDDLNPVKAGIADSLEDSDYTSIQLRISRYMRDDTSAESARAQQLISNQDKSISPALCESTAYAPELEITEIEYIKIAQSTLQLWLQFSGKSKQNTHPKFVYDVDVASWQEIVSNFGELFRTAAGSKECVEKFNSLTSRTRKRDKLGRKYLYH